MIETRAVEGLVPVETTDEGATLESLYRTHAKRIYSLAYRFAGNAADAEELLQDIFLLAYRKLDSFRHEAALSTWLHRLAVNRCLDHVRSRAARQDAATEPLNAEAPPPGARRRRPDHASSTSSAPSRSFRTDAAWPSCCTTSRGTGTGRSPSGSASPPAPPSRRCTRRGCGSAAC